MKSKVFMILTIIALAGIVVAFNSSPLWAQQQASEDVRGAAVVPVEFSDTLDKQAIVGGGALNGADPEQVLFTIPPDAVGPPRPRDTFDFGGENEVDALANIGDLYFLQVIANAANLLVSFAADTGANAAWFETPAGLTDVQWTQANLNNPNPPGELDDLDALEVWGPGDTDDATFYSLMGEPGGVSVFSMAGGAYITQAAILAAVTALEYAGPANVDVDGLMVWDEGGDFDGVWNAGDTILFSIRALGNWDGGEIVELPFGGPAAFLNHGGHLWNTAFECSTAFGVNTEEVDAIEAVESPDLTFDAYYFADSVGIWYTVVGAAGTQEFEVRIAARGYISVDVSIDTLTGPADSALVHISCTGEGNGNVVIEFYALDDQTTLLADYMLCFINDASLNIYKTQCGYPGPTLTEWGLIVFAGLFILALIFVLRRRRVKVPTPA